MKDYYRILQVDPDADGEVIAAAYKQLARKHHPDMNPDVAANRRMQEINEAYAALGDPLKRAQYDQQRTLQPSWMGGVGRQPHPAAPETGRRPDLLSTARILVYIVIVGLLFSVVRVSNIIVIIGILVVARFITEALFVGLGRIGRRTP